MSSAAYQAEYRVANSLALRLYGAAWYAANRDRVLARQAEDRASNPEKFRARSARRQLGLYGLTQEDYDGLLEAQGGACAICGGINADGRRLAVDHNHETDAVRGLLCNTCNVAIGLLGDDPELVQVATDYLRYPTTQRRTDA